MVLVFFEICDADDSGNISPHEFYDLLKKNMATKEDKLKLKKIITYLFNQIDVNRDGVVTRVEFMRAASSNRELRRILDENMRIIQKNDKSTNNDFEEAFQEWLPGGFV